MLVHRIFAPISRILPSPIANFIRGVATAILTPLFWSCRSGHFRSSLRRLALSQTGEPIPWYSYPAIDYLSQLKAKELAVLEFGAGQSTLWWANRAKSVTSLESDPDWYRSLKSKEPPNVDLHLCAPSHDDMPDSIRSRQYDVVIVDSSFRYEAVQLATTLTKQSGLIVLDNSDVSWAPENIENSIDTDAGNTNPIAEQMAHLGFNRVDFYGHAPGVIRPQCTSIFFQPKCELFARFSVPTRVVY